MVLSEDWWELVQSTTDICRETNGPLFLKTSGISLIALAVIMVDISTRITEFDNSYKGSFMNEGLSLHLHLFCMLLNEELTVQPGVPLYLQMLLSSVSAWKYGPLVAENSKARHAFITS